MEHLGRTLDGADRSEPSSGLIISDRAILIDLWARCCDRVGITPVNTADSRSRLAAALVDIDAADNWPQPFEAPVIALVGADATDQVVDVLGRGVRSVLTWRDGTSELEIAIQRLLDGASYISPSAAPIVLGACARMSRGGRRSGGGSLTPRERDVLRALADGFTVKASARALGVSPKTVEAHRSRAFVKLGVHNQSEAILRVLSEPGLLNEVSR